MIFCEEVAEQLDIDDFGAIVAILSGRNVLTTRTKPRDALKGTSYASRAARRVFPKAKFPFGIKLPTIVGGYPPRTARILFTHKLDTRRGLGDSGQRRCRYQFQFSQTVQCHRSQEG